MKRLYPIKFNPIAMERVWGGNKLAKSFNKHFDPKEKIGESWEICDFDEVNSEIENGFLKGNTIEDLLETYLGELVGDQIYHYFGNQFPLLIKLLDINDMLSVQVHPDDEIAMEMYGSYGKAEAWYVLEASPEAKIYMGFNRDITSKEFYERCQNDTVLEVLNEIKPQKGDFIYIEPGTVHAAGGGLVIAEVQEPSDITYRLYDWGREHNPATVREMHLEEAIDTIRYNRYDPAGSFFRPTDDLDRELVNCEHFAVNYLNITEQVKTSTNIYDSFIIYFCIEGMTSFKSEHSESVDIVRGEFILIPASMGEFKITPGSNGGARLLSIFIPDITKREDYTEDEFEEFDAEDYANFEQQWKPI